MEKSNVRLLGVQAYELFPATGQIPSDLVEELGLLAPREEFDSLEPTECLVYQHTVAKRLEAVTARSWDDPRTQLLVVCGSAIYASRTALSNFDHIGFGQMVPYLPTFIERPETEAPRAPVIPLFSVMP
jgi:hypothetical protein